MVVETLAASRRAGTTRRPRRGADTAASERDRLSEAGVAANHVKDAHLAALALEHRAELVSFDHDFRRYAGLRHSAPT